ncbi:phBC6A51 family helix-turn-helix protein [Saccharococcus caldoxylosilyticus]|uniref:phBC6A51 family helix-turn-helix protein n=1 Tax=Saccharococcus caldoxylosilyticus TaxID=81408 RepID=UPI001C4DDD8C|nr:phBC6A51 family helix-turn-helix protein [Parageobacillus caldoxylosilyticus]QXJ39071.1 hypothetical protein BV455_02436 [Parageobacillus caldoxylosilyticus]BDG37240.1 hypothetical protein PcaKH15_31460 [Parageobacillus caldoxylosilyticus]BDG41031.1 hypothetical protein PcaKH16_31700 [Parageobacillus caldoxylosilyticus]BDG44782.1 hypothetical protein PcaKH35_31270 [Parageobacillus caldoxylosilyticus]
MNGLEQNFKKVEVPASLSEKQVKIAQAYAKGQFLDNFTIADFCKEQGISTKTFYSDEYKGNPVFMDYVTKLINSIVPQEELEAYKQMKKHVLKLAYKENPSVKEILLFFDALNYLKELDQRQQMERLGLLNTHNTTGSNKTLDEKKAILVGRLKGDVE